MSDQRNEIRVDMWRQVWVTFAEAAEITGLSRGHVYNLSSQGQIKTRPRGAYRVSRESLDAYLDGGNQ